MSSVETLALLAADEEADRVEWPLKIVVSTPESVRTATSQRETVADEMA